MERHQGNYQVKDGLSVAQSCLQKEFERVPFACLRSGPRAFLLANRHREENNVKTAVWMEIEKLRRASLGTLRAKHREVFQEETPCRHREHLFRRIAWRPDPGALFPGREYPEIHVPRDETTNSVLLAASP